MLTRDLLRQWRTGNPKNHCRISGPITRSFQTARAPRGGHELSIWTVFSPVEDMRKAVVRVASTSVGHKSANVASSAGEGSG